MSEAQILQLFGILYILFGFGFITNREYYKQMIVELASSKALLFITGVFALVMGFVLVTFYSVWEWRWEVLVPVLGVWIMIESMFILCNPTWGAPLTRWMNKNFGIAYGVVTLVIGMVFLFLGYIVL